MKDINLIFSIKMSDQQNTAEVTKSSPGCNFTQY